MFCINDSIHISEATQKKANHPSAPIEVALLLDTKPPIKPYVVTPLEDITVIEGDVILLKAEFNGHPQVEYTWLKDNEELTPTERTAMRNEGNISILEILDSVIDDEADYICIASNENGECETLAEVLVDGKI